jgi:hypothetical protein
MCFWFVVITLGLVTREVKAEDEALPKFGFDDYLVAPLRIHLLEASDQPNLQTTLKDTDVSRILRKANGVWSQAGIHFYVESLVHEEAAHPEVHEENWKGQGLQWLLELMPESSRATNAFNVYYLKRFGVNGVYFRRGVFVKDTAGLKSIEGGIDEPIPRVTSHELGHALSLPHRQNVTNLMSSGTTGTNLNAAEISDTRKAASKFSWIHAAPDVLKRADDAYGRKEMPEARELYRRIADIPVAAEAVEKAKKRGK